jgi:hypothetical protein
MRCVMLCHSLVSEVADVPLKASGVGVLDEVLERGVPVVDACLTYERRAAQVEKLLFP